MKVPSLALLALIAAAHSFAAVPRPAPAPPIICATSFYVIDSKSGYELATLESDRPVAPASLPNLMTSYVVFQALPARSTRPDGEVAISETAGPSPGVSMVM